MTRASLRQHDASAQTYFDPTVESLFPLRLTPFENYMLWDARLGSPMTFFFRMEVQGTVDHEALQEAVVFASQRHPLCRATVQRGRWGGHYWTLDQSTLPQIFWPNGSIPAALWTTPPDLAHEAGVRLFVQQRDCSATLTIQFHHACCDGVGAAPWLEDLLFWYARLTGEGPPPEPAMLQPERLLDRRRRRLDRIRGWRWFTKGMHEIGKFFCQLPEPLRTPEGRLPDADSPSEPFVGILERRLSAEETQCLRRKADALGATLNECLVRDLFSTIAEWNGEDERDRSNRAWYRINMPTSLRERADRETPSANLMSMTFFNRRRSVVVGSPDQLFAGIRDESEEIRRLRRGTLFLDGLMILQAAGMLPLVLRLPFSLATAVLTNVGDPARRFSRHFPRREGKLVAGNLLFESFGGVPPLRPLTHAAIGVSTYLGQLTVNVQMTPGLFGAGDVQQFLDSYIKHIRAGLERSSLVNTR